MSSGISGSWRASQPPAEGEPEQERQPDQPRDLRRRPGVARAAPGQRQQQGHRRAGDQHRAENVELVRPLMARQPLQRRVRHPVGGEPQRQVDPEDHRPVQRLGDHAAEHRPEQRRGHEDGGDIDLVFAALLGRHHVGDDGLRQRDQPAAAEPLDEARQHEQPERRRERAGDRADDEDDDAREQRHPPPMDVGELAVERRHGGGGEQIGRHHPGQMRHVAELAPDRRHGGGDDGLVQRRQEHGEHDAEDDGADIRMGKGRDRRLRLDPLVHECSRLTVRLGNGSI